MKKTTILLILTCLIFTACLSYQTAFYEPGIYEGQGTGYRGMVRVRVTISQNGIEDIEIMENNEDGYAAEAMEELRETALETGSIKLDTVSGATVSCTAFFNALDKALVKATSTRR